MAAVSAESRCHEGNLWHGLPGLSGWCFGWWLFPRGSSHALKVEMAECKTPSEGRIALERHMGISWRATLYDLIKGYLQDANSSLNNSAAADATRSFF